MGHPALVRPCDQAERRCSDDCATEATSAGLMANEALHVKLWTAEARASDEKALALTQQEPERQFLQERIRQLK